MKSTERLAVILVAGVIFGWLAYALPQLTINENIRRSRYAIDPQTLDLAQDPAWIGGVTPR